MAKIKLTRKKILLGIALTFLVVAIGAALWLHYASRDIEKQSTATIPFESTGAAAMEYAYDGDIDKGMQLYDQQIEAQEDDQKRLDLLIGKADYGLNNERYDDALATAKQAEELDPEAVVLILAKIYEAQGNKDEALKYYQKLLDDGAPAGRDGDRWQHKVEELSSQ